MVRAPVRRVDLLTGAFSSYQVHISEIPILSSFQFFYLLSISEHGKSPVCFCISVVEERTCLFNSFSLEEVGYAVLRLFFFVPSLQHPSTSFVSILPKTDTI
jgi:hypothetical protein